MVTLWYSKADYISAEVFNVKEVMEDSVEKVNPGDVKTEPDELLLGTTIQTFQH